MTSEVLIIGGGVIGLSIARELHLRGVRDITLIEKGRCGRGASWAAAGMLSPQVDADKDDAFFRFSCASRDLFCGFVENLESQTDLTTGFDRTGTLVVSMSEEDEAVLRKRCDWQRQLGFDVELIYDELVEMEPLLSRDVRFALRFPNDWQIESRRLLSALRRYVDANNVVIREDLAVEAIETENTRAVGARTAIGTLSANTIILATGAWGSLIDIGGEMMPFSIEPVRGQIISMNPEKDVVNHVIYARDGYVLQREGGKVLAGATSENVGFNNAITEDARSKMHQMASKVLPKLGDEKIVDQWSGLRPRAADDLPILGSIGIDNLIIATGHYRNGILLAPITAKIVADSVVSGVESEYFYHFSPLRFSSKRTSIASV